MATTFSIIVLALLLTGMATATAYAVPAISQVTSAQTQAEDGVQTQDHLQLQTRTRNGEQAQTQTRLHLRDGLQNGNGSCDGSGSSMQGALGQAEGEMYQNQYCEQTHIRAQHRNGLDLEPDAIE